MDFGFEKIMEFAMKIDKLNMANLVLVGKVMDKITKRLPKTIFKGKNCKTSLSITGPYTRPSCPIMSKCKFSDIMM